MNQGIKLSGTIMIDERRTAIRRMNLSEAEQEARWIALEFLSSAIEISNLLEIQDAVEDQLSLNFIGKIPSRWIVTTRLQHSDTCTVVDTPPVIEVDLVTNGAKWKEQC